ncbi:MAG: ABC transporter ATP-binding protein [Desulfobacteraceae bacterium]|jgi:ABC-2 type transport system ATP-binding protein/lipopolysaccharide transport system ATP-binding protein|nr:MAG: ABC transporter ATP-binding protein [Desulfobacteraceae bacterium]
MPFTELNSVCVDFPVFTSRSRGLVNTLFMYTKQEQRRVEKAGMFGYTVHALRDINVSLGPGDRIGLIGRNGAGKTTLLRVMSGVYEPSSGTVRIEGRISSLTDIMLGMDPDANGYENIVLRGIVLGLSRKEAASLIPDVADFSGLGQYLDLPVSTYSTGMMLRLAFAVSTAVVPEILLMDEMIGAGDAHFVEKAQSRINKVIENVSILVIASHNEEIIKRFCTRGILLDEGRIKHMGSVDECMALHKEGSSHP